VLKLKIREEKPVSLISEKMFFETVKGGFGQRRKTLGNSLAGVLRMEKQDAVDALNAAGIDPGRRAETLDINEFAALANELAKSRG
jgi:16S rRNA (adenine1518-N6/adenine1519-N6)-dimethyltransferase